MFAVGPINIRDICGCSQLTVCVCVFAVRATFSQYTSRLVDTQPLVVYFCGLCRRLRRSATVAVAINGLGAFRIAAIVLCNNHPLPLSLTHSFTPSPIYDLIDIMRFVHIYTCIFHANDVVIDRASASVCVEWVLLSSFGNCKVSLLLVLSKVDGARWGKKEEMSEWAQVNHTRQRPMTCYIEYRGELRHHHPPVWRPIAATAFQQSITCSYATTVVYIVCEI